MFSGIVEEKAKVEALAAGKLRVLSTLDHSATKIGDSIAINGVCLTVTTLEKTSRGYLISFDVSDETLRRSVTLNVGGSVNLERALVFGGRVHGHIVTGHVDGTATLVSKKMEGESIRLEWQIPNELICFIAEKGSIALSGVSLLSSTLFLIN